MVVAEALAHGLPVVSTRVGAIAGLVGAAAGVLVSPGDAQLLTAALRRVLTEPGLLESLAAGAATVRGSLPNWPQASARMSRILENPLQRLQCR
jgi:glycosyltransferase involved in cell wall biosynthesis